MNPIYALLAPLALLIPSLGGAIADNSAGQRLVPPQPDEEQPADASAVPTSVRSFVFDEAPAYQVRIEQRVTIRIVPRDPAFRPSLLARLAPNGDTGQLTERKMGKCVPISGIAAVQPDASDRLLLFMRDQRLVSASLEKACSARDFYSGFYLERTGDGLLCVGRDKLHSRAGASCAVSRLRQLVADDE